MSDSQTYTITVDEIVGAIVLKMNDHIVKIIRYIVGGNQPLIIVILSNSGAMGYNILRRCKKTVRPYCATSFIT